MLLTSRGSLPARWPNSASAATGGGPRLQLASRLAAGRLEWRARGTTGTSGREVHLPGPRVSAKKGPPRSRSGAAGPPDGGPDGAAGGAVAANRLGERMKAGHHVYIVV